VKIQRGFGFECGGAKIPFHIAPAAVLKPAVATKTKKKLFFIFMHSTRSRVSKWDIELAGSLANAAGPVPLVLDLRIAHERFGSSSDPSINGHLHYPNDVDGSLNETATDKIRTYRTDYKNNPPNSTSFMPAILSTSGRIHSEFVRLLFLQDHRETDRFFAVSSGAT
jgi:hypothetical protein